MATYRVSHGDVAVEVPVDELVENNRGDEELCEWINAAGVGDQYRTGGAFGDCTVERLT